MAAGKGLKYAVAVALSAVAILPGTVWAQKAPASPQAQGGNKPALSQQDAAAKEAAAQHQQLVDFAQSNRAAAIQAILNKWGNDHGERLQAVLEAMPAGKLADIMASSSDAEVQALLSGGGTARVDAGILDLGDLQADLVLTAINPPCRAVDTRNIGGVNAGPPIPAGSTRSYILWGGTGGQGGAASCPNPKGVEGPLAGSINVTAIPVGFAGHLRVFPYLAALPVVSFVNFASQNIANAGIISICPGVCTNDISIYNASTVHYAVDVMGFFYRSTEVPLGLSATGATTDILATCTNYSGGSVTITVPGPGYITITAQAVIRTISSGGAFGTLFIGSSASDCPFGPTSSEGYVHQDFGIGVDSNEIHDSTALSRTVFVSSGGTRTYYLNATSTPGTAQFWYAAMQARYSPQ